MKNKNPVSFKNYYKIHQMNIYLDERLNESSFLISYVKNFNFFGFLGEETVITNYNKSYLITPDEDLLNEWCDNGGQGLFYESDNDTINNLRFMGLTFHNKKIFNNIQ